MLIMSIAINEPSDLAPLTGPLAVVETVQRAPSGPIAHAHAKIIHVMAGRTRIETPDSAQMVVAGDVVTVAAGSPCLVRPDPWVRSWTLYLDETFLRSYMRWAMPDDAAFMQDAPHLSEDAHRSRVHLSAGTLARLEPIWRRMSLTTAADSYSAAATVMMLFAQAVGVVVPELLPTVTPPHDSRRSERVGRSRKPLIRAEVSKAVALLEEHLTHPWRLEELASAVALSTSQLNRLFQRHLGTPPIRMLAELRVTEFTRLIEETDLTIGAAAKQVGWNDSRLASKRFQHRYGVSPRSYRYGTG